MNPNSEPSERIQRLTYRYQSEMPKISIDRAKYYTEKWLETENQDIPLNIRVALSMKNVYEKMRHHVDPDDRIAGYWTESFMGMPIDVERGVFNGVLRNELKKGPLIKLRIKSIFKTLGYLLKRREVINFIRNSRIMKSMGTQPMNLGIKTMMEREINPYTIDEDEKRELLKEILPKWKGKTTVEVLERDMYALNLLEDNMKFFNKAVPANNSKQTTMISPCATISTYMGHVIIDFENIIKKGLLVMKSEVEKRLNGEKNSEEQKNYLESVRIALEGVMTYARRLTDKVEEACEFETDPEKQEILKKMLDNCKNVPLNPPKSFYEAVQAAWTVKTAVELAHPVNLHCFGRMDQILYPYYKKDIDEGKIKRHEASELLEELLLKVMSQNIRPESNLIGNFYHRFLGSTPITLGGKNPNGTDATNDLTYLFIEAAQNSRAVTNISLRVHENTPDDVLFTVADALHAGSSNISLFNDEINIGAMRKRGISEEDSHDYAVMGCVECCIPGKTGSMSANALLLTRLLDVAMRNGNASTLLGKIKDVAPKFGDPDECESFEDFLDIVLKHGKEQVKKLVELSNFKDKIYADNLPAPYISAFMDGCLQKKKDITRGGAIYDLTGISFINSIANLTDSLYSIKKIIFEKKLITFKELLKAIDTNFRDHKELHREILSLSDKFWGNGFEEVDELARKISTTLFEETYQYKNFRSGPVVPYSISMTTHTIDGRISIASPDGRKAATPYAASCNCSNVEQHGETAVMRSIAALDFQHVLGCAVNMKFHPTAVGKTKAKRKKWIALLRTYFKIGGSQLQPTVVSSEILQAAQENPDQYRNIIVKVGGYSAYFTELGIEIQKEVIARTEH